MALSIDDLLRSVLEELAAPKLRAFLTALVSPESLRTELENLDCKNHEKYNPKWSNILFPQNRSTQPNYASFDITLLNFLFLFLKQKKQWNGFKAQYDALYDILHARNYDSHPTQRSQAETEKHLQTLKDVLSKIGGSDEDFDLFVAKPKFSHLIVANSSPSIIKILQGQREGENSFVCKLSLPTPDVPSSSQSSSSDRFTLDEETVHLDANKPKTFEIPKQKDSDVNITGEMRISHPAPIDLRVRRQIKRGEGRIELAAEIEGAEGTDIKVDKTESKVKIPKKGSRGKMMYELPKPEEDSDEEEVAPMHKEGSHKVSFSKSKTTRKTINKIVRFKSRGKKGKMTKTIVIEYPRRYEINYPLHSACKNGDTEKLEEILENSKENPNLLNKRDCFGCTPLLRAVVEDQEEMAMILVESGADVNIPNKEGQTCLMMAAQNGALHVVQLIISKGTNIHCKDENGDTALLLGIGGGHFDIVEELFLKGANANSHEGDKCALRKALEMGAEAKKHYQYKRVVSLLIKEGYDLDWRDSNDYTTLQWARAGPHKGWSKCLPNSLKRKLEHAVITTELRSFAPTFKDGWETTEKWSVGEGFVHLEHEGRIYIWGGHQRQPVTKEWLTLPCDVIHIFDLKKDLWEKKRASGNIPEHSIGAACVKINDMAYIFGGRRGSNLTTDIVSLSPTDCVFKSLPVSGDKPTPIYNHRGWAYKGKAFFFGGLSEWTEIRRENLLSCFSPGTNEWSKLETKGQSPSPREEYGVAVLENRVFIHGGTKKKECDMHSLDMKSMIWTQVKSKCGPRQLEYHSLSPISSSQLLLVGGGGSRKVWTFNVNDSSWKEQDQLSDDIVGADQNAGMVQHGAIHITTDEGLKVVCFGGRVGVNQHSQHLLILSIT